MCVYKYMYTCKNHISSVQSLSVQLFVTPWIAARQASLSITNSRSLLKLMSIELVMPSSHLILCRPLLLLPPIPPSIRVFSSESALRMRWPNYWSFSISPSNEYSGLISLRMDWLDLLAVQGTLKSLLQHHSSKHQLTIIWTSLEEISPEYSLEGLMLKLKLQNFGHLMRRVTHLKRPWCWERLRARGGGDDRRWDGWMASPTQWTWVWVSSGSWWWTRRPGMLQSMGSQIAGSDWATELNFQITESPNSQFPERYR